MDFWEEIDGPGKPAMMEIRSAPRETILMIKRAYDLNPELKIYVAGDYKVIHDTLKLNGVKAKIIKGPMGVG